MDAGRLSFESEWPELASRLTGALRRRGASSWLADDIVQETGLRLFKMWDSVDPDNSPWGLTLTIGKNLLWDETHRRASREVLVELPERPIPSDVENAGIARLELWRVARALRKMSPAHRSVLLAEVGGRDVESISAAATKMLRMRARRRLSSILESASASVFATLGLVRRHAFGVQQFVRRSGPALEGSATATVAAIVGVVIVMVPTEGVTAPRTIDRHDGPSQTTLISAGRDKVDGIQGALRDGMRSSSADADRKAAKGDSPTKRHSVSVGDENIGGEVTVESRQRKKKRLIKKPDCEVDDSRPDEVTIRCTIHTQDERHTVEATVRTRVNPDDLP
jgi:DNA-directed RNA polymerase specialized sigma24 family protein